jgi:hypothetical protein
MVDGAAPDVTPDIQNPVLAEAEEALLIARKAVLALQERELAEREHDADSAEVLHRERETAMRAELERQATRLAELIEAADARDKAAEIRDRAAEARSIASAMRAEAGARDQSLDDRDRESADVDRLWAGADRDAAAIDRARLMHDDDPED